MRSVYPLYTNVQAIKFLIVITLFSRRQSVELMHGCHYWLVTVYTGILMSMCMLGLIKAGNRVQTKGFISSGCEDLVMNLTTDDLI